jgi:hypothetical protein
MPAWLWAMFVFKNKSSDLPQTGRQEKVLQAK